MQVRTMRGAAMRAACFVAMAGVGPLAGSGSPATAADGGGMAGLRILGPEGTFDAGGTVMVALRTAQDWFGGEDPSAADGQVSMTIAGAKMTVSTASGSREATINGQAVELPRAPETRADLLHVPLRWIASDVAGYRVQPVAGGRGALMEKGGNRLLLARVCLPVSPIGFVMYREKCTRRDSARAMESVRARLLAKMKGIGMDLVPASSHAEAVKKGARAVLVAAYSDSPDQITVQLSCRDAGGKPHNWSASVSGRAANVWGPGTRISIINGELVPQGRPTRVISALADIKEEIDGIVGFVPVEEAWRAYSLALPTGAQQKPAPTSTTLPQATPDNSDQAPGTPLAPASGVPLKVTHVAVVDRLTTTSPRATISPKEGHRLVVVSLDGQGSDTDTHLELGSRDFGAIYPRAGGTTTATAAAVMVAEHMGGGELWIGDVAGSSSGSLTASTQSKRPISKGETFSIKAAFALPEEVGAFRVQFRGAWVEGKAIVPTKR